MPQKTLDMGIGQRKILLLGHVKAGKTNFLRYAGGPKANTYIFLFEQKEPTTLRGINNIWYDRYRDADPIAPTAWAAAWDTLIDFQTHGFLDPNGKEYDVLVIDSLTGMQDILKNNVLHERFHHKNDPKDRGIETQTDYKHELRKLTTFMESVLATKCHVIVTAHIQYLQDDFRGDIIAQPAITGGRARSVVPTWFNDILYFYTELEDGGLKYMIRTLADNRHVAGIDDSNRKLIPEVVDATDGDPWELIYGELLRETSNG